MDARLTQTEQAMLEMVQLGLDRTAVSALLETEGYHRDLIKYLEGPIVVSRRGMVWADTLPVWLAGAIWQDRLERIILEHKEDSVGKLGTLSEGGSSFDAGKPDRAAGALSGPMSTYVPAKRSTPSIRGSSLPIWARTYPG